MKNTKPVALDIKGFDLEFTNNWFSYSKHIWDELIPAIKPKKILEIGVYEGACTCYLIHQMANRFPIEMHCIDTWKGGVEHQSMGINMRSVEKRFNKNTRKIIGQVSKPVELVVHKGKSSFHLAKLIADGYENYFDFIYVDGSHQAPDVLADAVMGFQLLKVGGHIVFDDYLWSEDLPGGKDLLRCPKPAIDAFINIHFRQVEILHGRLYQLYVKKISR